MHTYARTCISLVPMPEEEEEKRPGFSNLHMHLIATDLDQWEGANDALKSDS